MKIKKIVSILMAVSILISTTGVSYASFNDVQANAVYKEAVDRMASLGLIKGTGDGNFNPYDNITREQFATIIVKAAGLEETAKSLGGTTIFSDVNPSGWSSGFINTALSKGYITGMADGSFHPQEGITFAQACTIFVRALGYADTDVSGMWPKNYIEKAKNLELVPGLDFAANDYLPRWAAAVMVDKLLVTEMKTIGTDSAAVFADSTGLYTSGIILANSSTLSKLTQNQVLTDKGTFYVDNTGIKLEIGSEYKLSIKNDVIVNAFNAMKPSVKISVDSVVDTNVTYISDGMTKTITLPDKTIYYYNGVKQNYEDLKSLLQGRTSIILAYNKDKTGFEYGVIVDPVYSKPQIVSGYGIDAKVNGSIDLSLYSLIKDGEVISQSDIEEGDVVYLVSDVWNENQYIQVARNTVSGEITNILPNKSSPKFVQVGDVDYEIGKDININKVNTTPGSFKVGDSVTLIIGNDDRIADIRFLETEDNSYYALVINTGYTISDSLDNAGEIVYNVKLLLSDGSNVTYNIDNDPKKFKGKLVKYQKLDSKRIAFEELEYIDQDKQKEHTISTDQMMIDNDYVAENVKIFDVLTNEANLDVEARLIDWDKIPRGFVEANKIQYINKSGPFEDINVMATNDLFDEKYRLAVVKSASGGGTNKSYTLLIDGKEYSLNDVNIPNITMGSVVKVKMLSGKVDSIVDYPNVEAEGRMVQAVDSRRIMIGNKVYWFSDNARIYLIDSIGSIIPVDTDDVKSSNSIVSISTKDIDVNLSYIKVSVYVNKSTYYGGKVEVVVLKE